MVDNRSAGFYGIGGAFNFKSGDVSGTAAKTADDKQDQGTEYMLLRKGEKEEEQEENKYVDRSAQLRASLNSLAVLNAANVRLRRNDEKKDKKNQTKKEQQIAENEAERQ
ncbi:MAG: hypothetical protein E7Z91_03725 [Cyanobacteria bacterium SIG30]|nr:hypothetical protein [Cyanobacteria bacterium SIG30]